MTALVRIQLPLLKKLKRIEIMSDLKDFRIVQDAGQRTEWINKRTPLSETQKQYVEFQIKEAITNVLRLANVDNKEQDTALRLHEVV